MGENDTGEVDPRWEQAADNWLASNPAKEPYTQQYPEDSDLSDLKKAFIAGIEWAVFNAEI